TLASAFGALGQIAGSWVGVGGVGEDVDQIRNACCEGAVEGGTQVGGAFDGLAGAAEGFHHVVVAAPRLQVGGDVVAVDRLHRVFLQSPDAVVADDGDDRKVVADEGVEVEA